MNHDPHCTGHHCTECGGCLDYDPTDPELQEICHQSAEDLAVCGECKAEREAWK